MLNEFNFIFGNDQIYIEFDQNSIAWFYAKQIAKVLEYSHAYNMNRMLIDNESVTLPINNPTIPEIGLVLRSHHNVMGPSDPTVTLINEFGLYRIIFNARNDAAKAFQNKVFYDILPSIRKYGAYIDPTIRAQLDANPNLIHDLNSRIAELENRPKNRLMTIGVDKSFGVCKRYEDAKQLNKEQAQYIQDNMPYTILGQAVAVENGDITIDMLAHIIQMRGYPTGTNRMYEELRSDGFLNKYNGMYNHPSQAAIDAGLMRWICRTDATGTYNKVYITPKGQEFFVNYYMNKLTNNSNSIDENN